MSNNNNNEKLIHKNSGFSISPIAQGIGNVNIDDDGQVTTSPSEQYLKSVASVNSDNGDISLISTTGLFFVGDNTDKTITIELPAGEEGQTLIINSEGKYIAGTIVSGIQSIEDVSNSGGNVSLKSNNGLLIITNNTTKAICINLPEGNIGDTIVIDDDGNYVTRPLPEVNIIQNQDGGADGKILRITTYDNTWTLASNTDTVDQLFKTCLAFKFNNKYYAAGSIITGLNSLTTGSVYYLDTAGNMTDTMPILSSNTKRVALGSAIAVDTFHFNPGEVVAGAI